MKYEINLHTIKPPLDVHVRHQQKPMISAIRQDRHQTINNKTKTKTAGTNTVYFHTDMDTLVLTRY